VRHAVQQDHPAVAGASLASAGEGDVDHFVLPEALPTRADDLESPRAGIDREDASLRTGRILETGKRHEEDRAHGDPSQVEPWPEASNHLAMIRNVTRDEIERKLIAIVREEKDIAEDLLKGETPLADAGIDSLDSLTILFAIEEQFHISIPDDRARAMKTFGDMIDIVEELVPNE
jgi:acyl carrier protein